VPVDPFDPTKPFSTEEYLARKRARAAAGVVPVRGDYPGRDFALSAVTPGWPIYSTERRYDGTEYPIGGVVVEVYPGYTDIDTGELRPTRYRTLDPLRPSHPWQWLEAPEVDVSALEGVGRQMCTTAAYWLLRQVNTTHLVLHPDDVGHIHDAWILGAAVVTL
jgi:hypothetical protein